MTKCSHQTNSVTEHTKHGVVKHEVKSEAASKSAVDNAQTAREVQAYLNKGK